MVVDIAAATRFLAGYGRLVDRHRMNFILGQGNQSSASACVDGYRNLDGGYGWGLKPDLRSASSQPGGALHAFEAFADIGVPTPRAQELCDWLASVSLPGGGLPFAVAIPDPAGCAPFWLGADPWVPSLQITTIVCAAALRVAEFDPVVAEHPWLESGIEFCVVSIREAAVLSALELAFSLQFLDAVHERRMDCFELVAHLGSQIPPSGVIQVAGGVEDECMRPLDFSPFPGGPTRSLFSASVIDEELSALASKQQNDAGGRWILTVIRRPRRWNGVVTLLWPQC